MSTSPFTNPPAKSSAGRKRLAVAGGVLGLLAVVGIVVLFSGSSEETSGPPAEVRTAAQEGGESSVQLVDGTLTVVETDRLVLEPFEDGKAEMEFVIDPADVANFDIAHMQSHSSVALPTRIYYERDGDRLLAKYKEDAPVNSQQDGS
jgi:hypothetical protein